MIFEWQTGRYWNFKVALSAASSLNDDRIVCVYLLLCFVVKYLRKLWDCFLFFFLLISTDASIRFVRPIRNQVSTTTTHRLDDPSSVMHFVGQLLCLFVIRHQLQAPVTARRFERSRIASSNDSHLIRLKFNRCQLTASHRNGNFQSINRQLTPNRQAFRTRPDSRTQPNLLSAITFQLNARPITNFDRTPIAVPNLIRMFFADSTRRFSFGKKTTTTMKTRSTSHGVASDE